MNDQFKIENNIPVPSGAARGGKYPFAEMEVGGSFFIKTDKATAQSNVLFSAKAWAVRQGNNWSFTTSRIDDGVRIWRVT